MSGCDGVDAQGVRFCLAKGAMGAMGSAASSSSSSNKSSKASRHAGRDASGVFKVRCRVADIWSELRGRGAGWRQPLTSTLSPAPPGLSSWCALSFAGSRHEPLQALRSAPAAHPQPAAAAQPQRTPCASRLGMAREGRERPEAPHGRCGRCTADRGEGIGCVLRAHGQAQARGSCSRR